jgi:hypothetical protein
MMVLGNFSLVAALLTWNFARHWAGAGQAGLAHQWAGGAGGVDAICGLFFGVSIGANLAALRLKRRCASGAIAQRG